MMENQGRTRLSRKPASSTPPMSPPPHSTSSFPDEPKKPIDAVIDAMIRMPDATPLILSNPPTNREQFDVEIRKSMAVFKAGAMRSQRSELPTIVRRIDQQPYGLSYVVEAKSTQELMTLSARLRSSGVKTLKYPFTLFPPKDASDRRDIIFIGNGRPDQLPTLGDKLMQLFNPREHMEVYNLDWGLKSSQMVMAFSLFQEELNELGLPQHPRWKEYLDAVDQYVKSLTETAEGKNDA